MVKRQLYLYEYIDAPYERVIETLTAEGASLFQDATDEAVTHAGTVHADLVVDVGSFEIGREVEIEIGEVEQMERLRSRVPVSWHAAEHAALFPSLSAELEVAALAEKPPVTQITIVGHYDPPMGRLGAAGDALWGHRIAEAALHRFLGAVIERLRHDVEHPPPS